MTAVEESNRAYLATALHWLRLRLGALADANSVTDAPKQSPSWPWGEVRHVPRLPPPRRADALRDARARMQETEMAEAGLALPTLARAFGLSAFERDVLLLCAAMELDAAIPALCARASGSQVRHWPTLALAFEAFEEPRWDVASPERPLRRFRMIEFERAALQPLLSAPMRIDERISAYINGLNYLDPRLGRVLRTLEAPAALAPSQGASVAELVENLEGQADVRLHLVGANETTRFGIAAATAVKLKRQPMMLAAEDASGLAEDDFLHLWERERRLLPLILVTEAPAIDHSSERPLEEAARTARLARLALRAGGHVIVSAQEAGGDAAHSHAIVMAQKPSVEEQANAWRDALGDEHASLSAALAAQFSLDVVSIGAIARAAVAVGDKQLRERLWRACARRARPALAGLAQCIETRQPWQALKLPKREEAALERLRDHMRNRAIVFDRYGFRRTLSRGLGAAALFCGESGVGKTLAAEVLATELELPLYRIDLAGVMNKYVGVTEKHLRQIFDVADGAILFFDECEALYGKRSSSPKDGHDRFWNLQLDYLLQRIEGHTGLSILATNMRSALDPALMRRLRFVVNFPFPGVPERAQIWRDIFPPETPRGDLDFNELAKLPLTGGSIQNVAVDAAFRAAAMPDGVVTMQIIAAAAEEELRKTDRASGALAPGRTSSAGAAA